jgi:integrase
MIEISETERQLVHMQLTSQTNQKDIHVLTDEEIQRIKDTIANGYRKPFCSRSGNEVLSGLYFPKQGSFFLFMLNSGIRAGEAVALKYSDFDFENRTVRIHETAVNTKIRNADGTATGQRNRTFTSPKTERSDALLHLNPEAIQIILTMKAQEPRGYDGYVVHSDYKPLAEKSLYQRFAKLLSGAGVQPCGLHSLRHTCGTKLYEATQDLKFVAQQLRHTDPGFTARTYVHQSDKRTREILATFKI